MDGEMSTDVTLIPKRQLVADLKAMLALRFEFGDALERKAIEMFKFSSATLGIAVGLGISRADIHGKVYLAVGFFMLLITYLIHIYFIYRALRPRNYSIVPGIPSGTISYNEFYESYVGKGEDGYLVQMISDLAGTGVTPGAITDGEIINSEKAKCIQGLGISFAAMIILLLVMGVLSIWF